MPVNKRKWMSVVALVLTVLGIGAVWVTWVLCGANPILIPVEALVTYWLIRNTRSFLKDFVNA